MVLESPLKGKRAFIGLLLCSQLLKFRTNSGQPCHQALAIERQEAVSFCLCFCPHLDFCRYSLRHINLQIELTSP
jgi:hypothetical protein